MRDYLFYSKGDLYNTIECHKQNIKKNIENQKSDYILNVNQDDYIEYLYNKYIINPLVLHEEEISIIEQKEIDVDVSHEWDRAISDRTRPFYIKGNSITIGIPYEGDRELFYLKPSTFSTIIPCGVVKDTDLLLTFENTNLTSEQIKSGLDKNIKLIKQYIDWQNESILPFNDNLKNYLKQLFFKRKDKLLKDLNLVASLGIPLRKNTEYTKTYVVPTTKKNVEIEKPIIKEKTFVPEPSIDMSTYEDILNTLNNMSIVMERCPEAFSKMDEESLRQHFLVQLNGIYEGNATGETFNANGKTDILMRENGKNVFIGECKFWKGDKVFTDTIDQILSYMCWRDTKGAILIFNRNKNLSNIIKKIPDLAQKHPSYKKEINIQQETCFRYIFTQPNDNNREILLTIMVFDIPVEKSN
ncbi:uncharacterized protein CBO05P1_285 [Clostridium botulinum B str. Osaka05]|uniref:Uncharacterized protein n=1 Tax=Clostridium botulinum B str. Osaka05 TaxID=1407017 RepID=A0A060N9N8_CLOBO|nr:hypothetical protein [Clostridium botulinum]BAO05004.1 uncharacterized protein CBO05P1_285 [Clostridium botulinum B str. Osaka05]